MRNEYGLTPHQMKAMLYIQQHFDQSAKLPTAGMLAGHMGLPSVAAAHGVLTGLEKAGFIWRQPAPVGSTAPRGSKRPGGVLKRVESGAMPRALSAAHDAEELQRMLKHLLIAARPFAHLGGTFPSSEKDEDMPILTRQRGVTIGGWRKIAGAYNAVSVLLEQRMRISRETDEEARRSQRAREYLESPSVD